MSEAWTDELALVPDETAPGRARAFVRGVLAENGWLEQVENALLLTTELTTNALLHAGTAIRIDVAGNPDTLTVRVADHTPGRLAGVPRAPDELHEGGRGLYLVDTLSSSWGTEHSKSGKAVWFRFARDGSAPASPWTMSDESTADLERILAADPAWLTAAGSASLEQLNLTEFIRELLWRAMETLGAAAGLVVIDEEESGRPTLAGQHGLAPDLAAELDERIAATRDHPRLPHHPGGDAAGLLLEGLGSRDTVAVALSLDGVELGWMELSARPDRRWTRGDLGLAQLAADRMALAVAGTRLREADQRRRGWLSFLAEASELLAGSLDVRLTLSLIAQLVLPTLADWSAVYLLDERMDVALEAVAHVDERRSGEVRSLLEGVDGAAVLAAVSEAVRTSSTSTALRTAVGVGDGLLPAGHPGLAVPLRARGRTLGALVLGRPAGSRHTAEERSLAEDLARRAALAVDNARLYGDRAAVARALQSWLLPPELPASEEIEFSARYLAAGEGNEVGGDFYDVFGLDGDGWGIAVGDVCGKGAEAAAVTGLVRDVIRLLVREAVPVTEVLGRLNTAILEQGDRGRFCTVAAGRVCIDGSDVTLQVCSAGHPLPVLMHASGELEMVGSSGTLVGVTEDFEVEEHTVHLAPGDAVVFYTDGVTERRTPDRMFGERRLLDTLAGLAGEPAAQIATGLERAVQDYAAEPLRDDLAILVVRRLP